jgi:[ribosomal protein S5]-alanine N-acetyltransferase
VAGVIRIETPRLVLSVLGPDDARLVRDHYERNLRHLERWEPARPPEHLTEAYWADRLAQAQEESAQGTALRLFLVSRETLDIVGCCNFTVFVREPLFSCRLGYHLDRDAEGQGYMHEGAAAAIRHVVGDQGITRIEATYDVENVRSARVLDRLGFEVEGHARRYLFTGGAWRDHVLTALVAR